MLDVAAPFTLDWPGSARFGAGRCDETGTHLASRGCGAALIVTDPGLAGAGILARVQAALDRAGIAHDTYDRVQPNPTTANVREAREAWQAGRYDALVALGGGSSIDTAKGALAEILTGEAAFDRFGRDVDAAEGDVPLFCAIPTTSGTGSESSLGAVLKSPERKFVIRGRLLQPRLVILDPELTLSLPPGMTACTGFDAFCHAIGAYANAVTNPVGDQMALAAMRLALDHLPTAVRDGASLEARAGMMLASYLGGVCIAQKGVDGIHGLCTPVESIGETVHGRVLATILPHMLRFNFATLAPRYASAARALGLGGGGDDAACCAALAEAAQGLAALTGAPEGLQAYGIARGHIPDLTRMALLSQATQRNGREMRAEQIEELYEAMIA